MIIGCMSTDAPLPAPLSGALRLRELARPVQDYMLDGQLDMGHARALLGLAAGAQTAAAPTPEP